MKPPAGGTPPRAAVVVNPSKAGEPRLRRLVEREAERLGWGETLWLETTVDDAGQDAARAALAAGVDLVLAAGGDGTARAVAEAMSGSEVPLAVIPLGTANLFVHNLDPAVRSMTPVVLTIPQAIRTAFSGQDKPVDIGMIEIVRPDGTRETHTFLVVTGVGLDAQMIANTKPELKKRIGLFAYFHAIARSLREARRVRVRSRIEDRPPRDGRMHSLLVGNCGYLPGNIPLLPDAVLDDGLLDFVTFRPEGWFGWIRVSIALFWENAVMRRSRVGRRILELGGRVRGVRYDQGAKIEVRLDKPDAIQLDGDSWGEAIGFTAWAEPGALIVRVAEASRLPLIAPLNPAVPARPTGSPEASPERR